MPTSSEKPTSKDFHTLGLEPDARFAEVRKAYRELAKRWHPDRFQQQPSFERKRAEEKFKEITSAYRRVSREWRARGKPFQETDSVGSAAAGRTERASGGRAETHPGSGARSEPGDPYRGRAIWRFSEGKFHIARIFSVGNLPALAIALLLVTLLVSFLPTHDPYLEKQEPSSRTANPAFPSSTVNPSARNAQPEDRGTSQGKDQLITSGPSQKSPGAPHRSDTDSSSSFFTLGSTRAEVLRIQGPPQRVHGQTWVYGLSEIQFKEGRVWRYNNFDHSLRVRVLPSVSPPGESSSFFTLGSTKDQVLLVQGTPTRIDASKWYYGFSEVRFKNGRVEDYDNYFGNLKVRLLPSTASVSATRQGYFTIGSSQDEVLAAQGTPTSIQGNFWFYHFSNILFRDGKVQHVVNATDNLHFLPPEDPAKELKGSEEK